VDVLQLAMWLMTLCYGRTESQSGKLVCRPAVVCDELISDQH